MNKDIDNNEFISRATNFIEKVVNTIEKYDLEGIIDIDVFDDKVVLRIGIDRDTKTISYILSKNSISKEIWLVSPLSGPHRFFWDQTQNKWRNSGQYMSEKQKIHEEFLDELMTYELSNFCDGIDFTHEHKILPMQTHALNP